MAGRNVRTGIKRQEQRLLVLGGLKVMEQKCRGSSGDNEPVLLFILRWPCIVHSVENEQRAGLSARERHENEAVK